MKKEQLKIAEVLYELGLSYEVIEKITSIAACEVQEEVDKKQKENLDE